MCGICGDIRLRGERASPTAVAAMTGTMTSRGPDDLGLHWQGSAALGHCRLKVMDTSDASSQPMVDAELGLSIVYNGAVYNYRELRAELETKGYRFFSDGDTEVILKAYDAWGERCVERFNGMFAFAIRRRGDGAVFMARDRLGIKPLYWAEVDGAVRFASTLPALLEGGGVDTAIDPVALHHYMTFHSVVPPPRTILRGVRKLPPATTLTLEPDGTRRQETYWRLEFTRDAEEEGYRLEEWKRLLLAALDRATERRLIADVPVGVLLSGGLDSSLVVGLLTRAGHAGIETFSIGFEAAGGEKGDEFEYSDVVAEEFATTHHQIRVPSERALGSLEACVAAMSEPMVSHDCIGFYLLSEEVSRHVTVVQSGQGADEVFAGYHWYPPMMEADADPVAAYADVFFDRDHEEMRRILAPELVGETDHSRRFVAEQFAAPGAERAIDKALRLDTTVMLVDDPVKRVDNMTMAFGLEARVPFLDHEVVELAARIPPELKVAQGGKHVLKEAAREVIPAAVIDRPKGYFPVPALKYLRGDYLERVREVLERPEARRRGLFQRAEVERLLAEPEAHLTPLRGSKLWQVALLEYWLQVHGIEGAG